MTYASANGVPVSRGELRLPLQGAWEASLTVAGTDAAKVSGPVVLDVAGVRLRGTASRSQADAGGLVTVRVVGGANGLATALPPKAYRDPSRRVLISDALRAGGESIDPTAQAEVLDVRLPRWTRSKTTAGELIVAVLASTGATFRVLGSGAWWVGVDSWPTVETAHVLEAEEPTRDELTIATGTLDVLPGATFRGRRISSAVYSWDGARVRAVLGYGSSRAGAAAELARFVARETASTAALSKPINGRVLSQNGDGTLEIRTYDASMPDLPRVPVKLGIPGVSSYEVEDGTECYVIHENGDAQRPCVVGFAPGSAVSITIDAATMNACGTDALALAAPLQSWASQVTAAVNGLSPGAVSPLVGLSTSRLFGS